MSVFHPNDPDTQREQRLIALMSRHKTQLMRMAYMYLGDAALAEDAVQETFLKAYVHLHRFRGESSEATWLTRICINVCKDQRRTAWFRHRQQALPLESAPDAGQEDALPDDTVLKAVMSLPEKDKQVILLRYYQEMTVPDVAKVLHITVSSATSRLNRAKAHLR